MAKKLAALAVLGGHVALPHIGARVLRNGQPATVVDINWAQGKFPPSGVPAPPGVSPSTPPGAQDQGLLASVLLQLDSGDSATLRGEALWTLQPLLVPLPVERVNSPQLLNDLFDLAFAKTDVAQDAKGGAENSEDPANKAFPAGQRAVLHALLRRQALKVIEQLLGRVELNRIPVLQARLWELVQLCQQGGQLPVVSLSALEDRVRALEFYEGEELGPQVGVDMVMFPTIASTTSDPTSRVPELTWKTDSKCANVSFRKEGKQACFNNNSAHRGIIAQQGFDSGVHEWQIIVDQKACCGYAGISLSADTCNSAASVHLADFSTCMGFSNFSENRNVGNQPGAQVRIRLDLENNTITYFHPRFPERAVPLPQNCVGKSIFPALESDENGHYSIELLYSSSPTAAPPLTPSSTLVPSPFALFTHVEGQQEGSSNGSVVQLPDRLSSGCATVSAVDPDCALVVWSYKAGLTFLESKADSAPFPKDAGFETWLQNATDRKAWAFAIGNASAVKGYLKLEPPPPLANWQRVAEVKDIASGTYVRITDFPQKVVTIQNVVLKTSEGHLRLPPGCMLCAPLPSEPAKEWAGFSYAIRLASFSCPGPQPATLLSVSQPDAKGGQRGMAFALTSRDLSSFKVELTLLQSGQRAAVSVRSQQAPLSPQETCTLSVVQYSDDFLRKGWRVYHNAQLLLDSLDTPVLEALCAQGRSEDWPRAVPEGSEITFVSNALVLVEACAAWRFALTSEQVRALAVSGLGHCRDEPLASRSVASERHVLNASVLPSGLSVAVARRSGANAAVGAPVAGPARTTAAPPANLAPLECKRCHQAMGMSNHSEGPYAGGWNCDLCRRSPSRDSKEQRERWFCLPCQSDICFNCVPRRDPPPGQSLCPAGHALTRFNTERADFRCDVCSASFNTGSVLYGCRTCNFDSCPHHLPLQPVAAETFAEPVEFVSETDASGNALRGVRVGAESVCRFRRSLQPGKELTTPYTLSFELALSALPAERAELLSYSNLPFGPAVLQVEPSGRVQVLGKPTAGFLLARRVHCLRVAWNKTTSYGYVMLDRHVLRYFSLSRGEAAVLALPAEIVLLGGVVGSLHTLQLESSMSAVGDLPANLRAPLASELVPFQAMGFEPAWATQALTEVGGNRALAVEWIMARPQLLAEQRRARDLHANTLVLETLSQLGFSDTWCKAAIARAQAAYPVQAQAGEVNPGRRVAMLLQVALAPLAQPGLGDVLRLSRPNLDSASAPLPAVDSKRSAAPAPAHVLLKDLGGDEAGALSVVSQDDSLDAFYVRDVSKTNFDPPAPSLSSDGRVADEFKKVLTSFKATRWASECALAAAYARMALLSLLRHAPYLPVFEQNLTCLLRSVEYSLPEGLQQLRELLIGALLNEVPALANCAPPSLQEGLRVYPARTPVLARLLQELLYQLLAVTRLEGSASQPERETRVIEGSLANPQLALFLLDVFVEVTGTLADTKPPVLAAQLRRLRAHVFSPVVVGLTVQVLARVAPELRHSFVRLLGCLLALNAKDAQAEPAARVLFDPLRCASLKRLMLQLYKGAGQVDDFLRSLIELNVAIDLDQLQTPQPDSDLHGAELTAIKTNEGREEKIAVLEQLEQAAVRAEPATLYHPVSCACFYLPLFLS